MRCDAFSLGLAVLLVAGAEVSAAPAGGRILTACVTNAQVRLSFASETGNSYQVQSCALVGSRYWSDALPVITGNSGVTTAEVPLQGPSEFFQVLEFTNRVFWYDWKYYYETPLLTTWGLGAPQTGYAHLDHAYEWYIDQADTGTYANNNCGPSSVTMAIKWHTQAFARTAADARNTYLRDGGWWYTSDIINYLNLYSVANTTSLFTGTNQLTGILNQGDLVILCISTAYLTPDYTAEHRVGRFYSFAGGHFLVVKGWRVANGGLFFEVYDPNNWHAAYADRTPKGRNRHLAANDLASAIANWWNYLIVVHPQSGGGKTERDVWLEPVDPAQIPHMWGK